MVNVCTSRVLLVGSYVEIYLSWCIPVKALVSSFGIVELEIFCQPLVCIIQVLVGIREHIFVFHGSP